MPDLVSGALCSIFTRACFVRLGLSSPMIRLICNTENSRAIFCMLGIR